MAENIARQLDVGLLLVTVISTDLSKSLHEASGVVTDLNPAPDLGSLLGVTPHLLQQAAEAFLHWLFPEGRQSRIPLVAVTGTNGKTTTCRMIARIMQTAGFKPGLATTSGVYINGELLREGDHAGTEGHHLVFESRKVDMGVLETARGGVATSGFMFDHCDVAVCLNVTEDHLGQYELHTVQDLAAIKRSILLRARKAIVINADYATCLDMLPIAGPPQIYAATLMHSLNEVRDLVGAEAWVCLCEFVGDEKWIVLHGPAGERLAVTAANDIPACFDGLARFNISNAQHAVCASHALGISTELIGAALAGFDSSYENNPGRLNIYRGLPFTVVMDYAHNRDGMESILQFLTDLQLKGRKLLLYAVTGDRSLEMLKEFSQLPVATFDEFICRNYTDDRGRLHPEFPSLMKQALMQAGVSEECITLVDVPEDGPGVALSLARPGDLLMMCPGSEELADMWNKILAFVPDFEPGDAQASTKH
jgi:cyanophycin synthetase